MQTFFGAQSANFLYSVINIQFNIANFTIVCFFTESHSKSLNSKRIDDEIFSSPTGSYIVSLNYGGRMFCIGALLSSLYVMTGSFCLNRQQISRRAVYIKLAMPSRIPRISYIKKVVVSSNEGNLTNYDVNFAVLRVSKSTHKILRSK